MTPTQSEQPIFEVLKHIPGTDQFERMRIFASGRIEGFPPGFTIVKNGIPVHVTGEVHKAQAKANRVQSPCSRHWKAPLFISAARFTGAAQLPITYCPGCEDEQERRKFTDVKAQGSLQAHLPQVDLDVLMNTPPVRPISDKQAWDAVMRGHTTIVDPLATLPPIHLDVESLR